MKTTLFTTTAAAIFWAAALPASAELTAGNVRAAQRPNTKLVDIDYDVSGVSTPVIVALEISSDGGITWSVPATTLTGAVGNNVTLPAMMGHPESVRHLVVVAANHPPTMRELEKLTKVLQCDA